MSTVVGCGLAPRVALLGVDEQAFYTVDGSRTFSAVARQTGQPTKLYHSQLFNYDMAEGTLQLSSAGFQGDKIYFLDAQDGLRSGGIMSLDPHTPGNPSLAVRADPQHSITLAFADGYVYFQDWLNRPSSAAPPPLVRAPLGGGPSQVVYAGQVDPFAVHGGYVYFSDITGAIRRAPIAGGADNLILSRLPPFAGSSGTSITYRDLAVDDSYLYVPVPSPGGGAPHTLQRYAVTGGDSGTIIASIASTGEVLLGPPTALRVDGDYVYFGLLNGLSRIKLGGDGHIETVSPAKSSPVFDATSIYVTEQVGGEDSPLQGVIVQIPK